MSAPIILAIDTSCDDTSVAITCGTTILSNVIASQTELHKPYGGVFPTVAKLAHRENIQPTIAVALKRARISRTQLDAVAVTVGPGLAPALEVGITAAKELATELNKPLIPVNHIEGHVLSVLAHPAVKNDSASKNKEQKLPVLSIIVSGGHTEFVLVTAIGEYQILGATLDDAAGECLDKIGRMLNLGYPAGPIIEEFAKLGNKEAFPFPLPLTTVKTFDISFSGMKTFARNLVEKLQAENTLTKTQIFDLCASAQQGVFKHICYKLNKVLEKHDVKEVWLGGGVAANKELRRMIRETLKNIAKTQKQPTLRLRVPYTKKLCADNAAMIGVVAGFKTGITGTEIEKIERVPRLRL
jgi:N6-L-threonylcarbamoyladenine synthase